MTTKNVTQGAGYRPGIVWVEITSFMRAWTESEYGGLLTVGGKRVITLHDIKEAREILRMAIAEDYMEPGITGLSVSANRMRALMGAMKISRETTLEMYGVTQERLDNFIPIECPRRAMTARGVLRPWAPFYRLTKKQADALRALIRKRFWQAVEEFDEAFAASIADEDEDDDYTTTEMIEAFMTATHTPACHMEGIRREWRRRKQKQQQS